MKTRKEIIADNMRTLRKTMYDPVKKSIVITSMRPFHILERFFSQYLQHSVKQKKFRKCAEIIDEADRLKVLGGLSGLAEYFLKSKRILEGIVYLQSKIKEYQTFDRYVDYMKSDLKRLGGLNERVD